MSKREKRAQASHGTCAVKLEAEVVQEKSWEWSQQQMYKDSSSQTLIILKLSKKNSLEDISAINPPCCTYPFYTCNAHLEIKGIFLELPLAGRGETEISIWDLGLFIIKLKGIGKTQVYPCLKVFSFSLASWWFSKRHCISLPRWMAFQVSFLAQPRHREIWLPDCWGLTLHCFPSCSDPLAFSVSWGCCRVAGKKNRAEGLQWSLTEITA